MPNTERSSGTDEKPSLTTLAGELQDLIITNLHPSAAISLSQTSHHFHACVSLHRLPPSVVYDWFREKEKLSVNFDNYACHTCLRLKPRSAFAKRQTRPPRGKLGQIGHTRICIDCGLTTGKHTPGSVLFDGGEPRVLCIGCMTLRKRFCFSCHWCDSCISKGSATVLRKGCWAGPNGEASEVVLRNGCLAHMWERPRPEASVRRLPIRQWWDDIDDGIDDEYFWSHESDL